jgi:hypothetical protein
MKTNPLHRLSSDDRFFLTCLARGFVRFLGGLGLFVAGLQLFLWFSSTWPKAFPVALASNFLELMDEALPQAATLLGLDFGEFLLLCLAFVIAAIFVTVVCCLTFLFFAFSGMLLAWLGGYKKKN